MPVFTGILNEHPACCRSVHRQLCESAHGQEVAAG